MAVYSELFQKLQIPHAFGGVGERPSTRARYIKQVHGAKSLCIDHDFAFDSEGDGVFSYGKNICAVKTADCVPILVAHQDLSFFAAIHAGWRGICLEVIPHFLEKISPETRAKCVFAIGPCISWEYFEVGPEVVAQFFEQKYFFDKEDSWLKHGLSDRAFIDLKKCSFLQLTQSGIESCNIDVIPACTYSDRQFYSYRRDKNQFTEQVLSNWSWVGP